MSVNYTVVLDDYQYSEVGAESGASFIDVFDDDTPFKDSLYIQSENAGIGQFYTDPICHLVAGDIYQSIYVYFEDNTGRALNTSYTIGDETYTVEREVQGLGGSTADFWIEQVVESNRIRLTMGSASTNYQRVGNVLLVARIYNSSQELVATRTAVVRVNFDYLPTETPYFPSAQLAALSANPPPIFNVTYAKLQLADLSYYDYYSQSNVSYTDINFWKDTILGFNFRDYGPQSPWRVEFHRSTSLANASESFMAAVQDNLLWIPITNAEEWFDLAQLTEGRIFLRTRWHGNGVWSSSYNLGSYITSIKFYRPKTLPWTPQIILPAYTFPGGDQVAEARLDFLDLPGDTSQNYPAQYHETRIYKLDDNGDFQESENIEPSLNELYNVRPTSSPDWETVTLDASQFVGTRGRLVFWYETADYRGDIQLDNIQIESTYYDVDKGGDFETTTFDVNTVEGTVEHYESLSFTNVTDSYLFGTNNQVKWYKGRGSTPSNSTGIPTDADGESLGAYLWVEASVANPASAWLRLPETTLTEDGQITFALGHLGAGIGRLRAYWYSTGHTSISYPFTIFSNKITIWPLPTQPGETYTYRMNTLVPEEHNGVDPRFFSRSAEFSLTAWDQTANPFEIILRSRPPGIGQPETILLDGDSIEEGEYLDIIVKGPKNARVHIDMIPESTGDPSSPFDDFEFNNASLSAFLYSLDGTYGLTQTEIDNGLGSKFISQRSVVDGITEGKEPSTIRLYFGDRDFLNPDEEKEILAERNFFIAASTDGPLTDITFEFAGFANIIQYSTEKAAWQVPRAYSLGGQGLPLQLRNGTTGYDVRVWLRSKGVSNSLYISESTFDSLGEALVYIKGPLDSSDEFVIQTKPSGTSAWGAATTGALQVVPFIEPQDFYEGFNSTPDLVYEYTKVPFFIAIDIPLPEEYQTQPNNFPVEYSLRVDGTIIDNTAITAEVFGVWVKRLEIDPPYLPTIQNTSNTVDIIGFLSVDNFGTNVDTVMETFEVKSTFIPPALDINLSTFDEEEPQQKAPFNFVISEEGSAPRDRVEIAIAETPEGLTEWYNTVTEAALVQGPRGDAGSTLFVQLRTVLGTNDNLNYSEVYELPRPAFKQLTPYNDTEVLFDAQGFLRNKTIPGIITLAGEFNQFEDQYKHANIVFSRQNNSLVEVPFVEEGFGVSTVNEELVLPVVNSYIQSAANSDTDPYFIQLDHDILGGVFPYDSQPISYYLFVYIPIEKGGAGKDSAIYLNISIFASVVGNNALPVSGTPNKLIEGETVQMEFFGPPEVAFNWEIRNSDLTPLANTDDFSSPVSGQITFPALGEGQERFTNNTFDTLSTGAISITSNADNLFEGGGLEPYVVYFTGPTDSFRGSFNFDISDTSYDPETVPPSTTLEIIPTLLWRSEGFGTEIPTYAKGETTLNLIMGQGGFYNGWYNAIRFVFRSDRDADFPIQTEFKLVEQSTQTEVLLGVVARQKVIDRLLYQGSFEDAIEQDGVTPRVDYEVPSLPLNPQFGFVPGSSYTFQVYSRIFTEEGNRTWEYTGNNYEIISRAIADVDNSGVTVSLNGKEVGNGFFPARYPIETIPASDISLTFEIGGLSPLAEYKLRPGNNRYNEQTLEVSETGTASFTVSRRFGGRPVQNWLYSRTPISSFGTNKWAFFKRFNDFLRDRNVLERTNKRFLPEFDLEESSTTITYEATQATINFTESLQNYLLPIDPFNNPGYLGNLPVDFFVQVSRSNADGTLNSSGLLIEIPVQHSGGSSFVTLSESSLPLLPLDRDKTYSRLKLLGSISVENGGSGVVRVIDEAIVYRAPEVIYPASTALTLEYNGQYVDYFVTGNPSEDEFTFTVTGEIDLDSQGGSQTNEYQIGITTFNNVVVATDAELRSNNFTFTISGDKLPNFGNLRGYYVEVKSPNEDEFVRADDSAYVEIRAARDPVVVIEKGDPSTTLRIYDEATGEEAQDFEVTADSLFDPSTVRARYYLQGPFNKNTNGIAHEFEYRIAKRSSTSPSTEDFRTNDQLQQSQSFNITNADLTREEGKSTFLFLQVYSEKEKSYKLLDRIQISTVRVLSEEEESPETPLPGDPETAVWSASNAIGLEYQGNRTEGNWDLISENPGEDQFTFTVVGEIDLNTAFPEPEFQTNEYKLINARGDGETVISDVELRSNNFTFTIPQAFMPLPGKTASFLIQVRGGSQTTFVNGDYTLGPAIEITAREADLNTTFPSKDIEIIYGATNTAETFIDVPADFSSLEFDLQGDFNVNDSGQAEPFEYRIRRTDNNVILVTNTQLQQSQSFTIDSSNIKGPGNVTGLVLEVKNPLIVTSESFIYIDEVKIRVLTVAPTPAPSRSVELIRQETNTSDIEVIVPTQDPVSFRISGDVDIDINGGNRTFSYRVIRTSDSNVVISSNDIKNEFTLPVLNDSTTYVLQVWTGTQWAQLDLVKIEYLPPVEVAPPGTVTPVVNTVKFETAGPTDKDTFVSPIVIPPTASFPRYKIELPLDQIKNINIKVSGLDSNSAYRLRDQQENVAISFISNKESDTISIAYRRLTPYNETGSKTFTLESPEGFIYGTLTVERTEDGVAAPNLTTEGFSLSPQDVSLNVEDETIEIALERALGIPSTQEFRLRRIYSNSNEDTVESWPDSDTLTETYLPQPGEFYEYRVQTRVAGSSDDWINTSAQSIIRRQSLASISIDTRLTGYSVNTADTVEITDTIDITLQGELQSNAEYRLVKYTNNIFTVTQIAQSKSAAPITFTVGEDLLINSSAFYQFQVRISSANGGDDDWYYLGNTQTKVEKISSSTETQPILAPQEDSYTVEQNVLTTLDVLANDKGNVSYTIGRVISTPKNGSLTLGSGFFTYQSNADYVGRDSFTYTTISIGVTSVESSPVTVNITVKDPQNPVDIPFIGDSYISSANRLKLITNLPNGGRTIPYGFEDDVYLRLTGDTFFKEKTTYYLYKETSNGLELVRAQVGNDAFNPGFYIPTVSLPPQGGEATYVLRGLISIQNGGDGNLYESGVSIELTSNPEDISNADETGPTPFSFEPTTGLVPETPAIIVNTKVQGLLPGNTVTATAISPSQIAVGSPNNFSDEPLSVSNGTVVYVRTFPANTYNTQVNGGVEINGVIGFHSVTTKGFQDLTPLGDQEYGLALWGPLYEVDGSQRQKLVISPDMRVGSILRIKSGFGAYLDYEYEIKASNSNDGGITKTKYYVEGLTPTNTDKVQLIISPSASEVAARVAKNDLYALARISSIVKVRRSNGYFQVYQEVEDRFGEPDDIGLNIIAVRF